MHNHRNSSGRRIVLATWGSFGDLHPYIALALELRARGHQPVLATCGIYREKVEAEGIEFHPVRPDVLPPEDSGAMLERLMDPRRGTEYLFRELLMPHFREQYADFEEAARGADLLVSHPITYAVPVLGELSGLPWVATVLQPLIFTSAYDPPVPPGHPEMMFLTRLGPRIIGMLFRVVKPRFRRWVEPVDELRAELGLPRGENPIFEGQFSPYLNLALFSRVLSSPQPDWPPNTLVTGFPFYDRIEAGLGMPPGLESFLTSGPPPVVFTLGTSAVFAAGDFYRESIEAVRRLGRRAVFLIGRGEMNQLPNPLPDGMLAVDYAPHSELFPRAAAIVHQGGVGTTGQALRAGRPTLVVPFAHDQPDNGYRVARLGGGRMLVRKRYNASRAASELNKLLEEPSYAARAAEIAREVNAENGTVTACDAIEQLLESRGSQHGRVNRRDAEDAEGDRDRG